MYRIFFLTLLMTSLYITNGFSNIDSDSILADTTTTSNESLSAFSGIIDSFIPDKGIHPLTLDKSVPLIESQVDEPQIILRGSQRIPVKAFSFVGNTVFSDKELEEVTEKYIGKVRYSKRFSDNQNDGKHLFIVDRKLSLKELNEVTSAIQKYYNRKGYPLVYVYIPEQTLDDGNINIKIVEGKLEGIYVKGNRYYKSSYIKSYLQPYQDEVIKTDDILRGMFLINDNMNVKAESVFLRGQAPGKVDILINETDSFPIHVYLDYNNYGSLFTAKNRTGARIDIGNVITNGAVLSLTGVMGYPFNGLNFANIVYKVPVTPYKTTLNFSYLASAFKVRSDFSSLDIKGHSNILSFQLYRPLVRNRRMSLNGFFDFDVKQINNFTLSQKTSTDKLRIVELGMNFEYIDTLKGRSNISSSIHQGIPNLFGGLRATDPNCSRDGGGGNFFILNLSLARIQSVIADSFITANFSLQLSPYKLPLPEQMYIGGPDSVRGFSQAAALGDSGYSLRLQIQSPCFIAEKMKIPFSNKTVKEALQLVAFLDQGQVILNDTVPGRNLKTQLTGTGIGLRFYGPRNVDASFDCGFPITGQNVVKSSNAVIYIKVTSRIW